jgi:hypothetical protein
MQLLFDKAALGTIIPASDDLQKRQQVMFFGPDEREIKSHKSIFNLFPYAYATYVLHRRSDVFDKINYI